MFYYTFLLELDYGLNGEIYSSFELQQRIEQLLGKEIGMGLVDN